MRQCRLLLMLLAMLALAGCANSRTAMNARSDKAPAATSEFDERAYGAPQWQIAASAQARQVVPVAMEPERPYTLDSGDRLRIVVFGQDTLSNNYIVDAEGRISFPLIGTVKARGSTAAQLAGSIRTALVNGFIREPNVSVEVETHRPFFVMGEVTYPGLYPYVPGMTVENAVAIAGGFTPRGYKDDAVVTRKFDGVPVRETMPVRTTPVHPGDIITVKERWF
jgi:polysaccharide export outer membrane protein